MQGRVQGVGFRPFAWNLAQAQGLVGWVANIPSGVLMHLEGPSAQLDSFVRKMLDHPPPLAAIDGVNRVEVAVVGHRSFEIRLSAPDGEFSVRIPLDTATCDACLREVLDPHDRRFMHPFANCTHCGPRYSIMRGIPYDRVATSLADFAMCPACAREYADPRNRRYHAQPICCPVCGPRMWFQRHQESRTDWLEAWVGSLQAGETSAVKGLGGFHLVCDATNPASVHALRTRKRRVSKPFALMAPDVAWVLKHCHASPEELTLLQSPAHPIVLLKCLERLPAHAELAPGLDTLGVMLPYTPQHHLLMSRLRIPLVMTSANSPSEPMLISNEEALQALSDVADAFVLHDRDIANRLDDSVVRTAPIQAGIIHLREGRGFSPAEFACTDIPDLVAFGADLKNTIAVSHHGRITLSQHIGDLDHPDAQAMVTETVQRFAALFHRSPIAVACDLHPDYHSTRLARAWAKAKGIPLVQVQHHHAHLAAGYLEHGLTGKAIGFAFDGTGFGSDGKTWGSEVMLFDPAGFERGFRLQAMRLPGGDKAVRFPWRILLALAFDHAPELLPHVTAWIREAHEATDAELELVTQQLASDLQCPQSSGMGRLFDAVAALAGICREQGYDGESGARLEALADPKETGAWPVVLAGAELQLAPVLRAACTDAFSGAGLPRLAARLHNTVAEYIVTTGLRMQSICGPLPWVLAGGVMQNHGLLQRLAKHPKLSQVHLLTSSLPNDNGIALGQVVVAQATLNTQGVTPCA